MPLYHRLRAALIFLLLGGGNLLAAPITLNVSGFVGSSTVNGAQVGAGSYTLAQLAAAGSAIASATTNGATGIPLWDLLGGNSSGASDVVTSTPAGDNGKNAILRYYVLATSVTGAQSIVSLGEIDPFFGGTADIPPFIAYSGTDGQPALIFPGAAGARDITDLSSLQILSVPALPNGAGGLSTSVSLSGNVANPGSYNLAALQALPAASVTIGADTYTGVPILTLLHPTAANLLTGYVVAGGTDGYEVLYSLAELNPAFGAPLDLVPYADTQGAFPADGLARVVIPGDNHAGRYVSNLDLISVQNVPEPGTLALTAAAFLLAALAKRDKKLLNRS